MLSWAARQHRGRTALIFGDDCLSYDDVEAGSNRLAHALISLGLQVGERVAVLLNNSPEAIESVFAVEKAGLVYVALNARHTLAEQIAILNDADAVCWWWGRSFVRLAKVFAIASPVCVM